MPKDYKIRKDVIDLTGQRFGRLLALSYVRKSKWLVQCDCGSPRKIVSRGELRRGLISCGCLTTSLQSQGLTKNLEGQRFGRWVVISRAPNKVRGATRWFCRCDCGTKKDVLANVLKSGASQSCGCLLAFIRAATPSPMRKADGMASLRGMFVKYRNSAEERGFAFELTWGRFQDLTSSPCHYCGVRHGNHYRAGSAKTPFKGNGVDRYDGSQGYTIENSVPCCKRCNFSKNTMRGDVFIEFCRSVAVNHQPNLNPFAIWSSVRSLERVM